MSAKDGIELRGVCWGGGGGECSELGADGGDEGRVRGNRAGE